MLTSVILSKSQLIIIYGNNSKINHNRIYVSEKDFLIPYGDTYKLVIKELKRIQNSTIHQQSILSLLSYDDVSIWWLIYPSLIPELNKIINFAHKFQILVKEQNPDKIKIENFSYFDLIQQICKSKNIKLEYSQLSFLFFSLNKKIKIFLQRYRYQMITRHKISNRKKLFNEKKVSIPSLKNKILFITHSSSWRNVIDSKSEHRGESWQNMIKLLKQEMNVVCMDLDYTLKGDLNVLEEKMKDENIWLPMEVILNSSFFQIEKQKIFFKNYKKIINSKQFQKLFDFQGLSLWWELENFFHEMLFLPYIPLYLKLLDSTKAFFEENKPNSVFLSYETGSLAQCFIASLNKLHVKTIGMQHGIIYHNSSNYSFDDFYSSKNPLGFPLPDFLLLFGEYAKTILKENNYPIERLITFGNSFFFDFDKIEKKLNNENLLKKYNINKSQKVILFTTATHQRKYTIQGKYDFDEQIWRHLLENFAGNDDYFLILKPHPIESNIEPYLEILEKFPSNNVKIIQSSLFELISISTVLISIFSTTMIDALCFRKNVIQVVFDNVKWPIPVEEYGVVLPSELSQLSKNIISIFKDKNLRKSLAKNRDDFIKHQFNIPEKNPLQIIRDIISS